jgi:hypothetical protein
LEATVSRTDGEVLIVEEQCDAFFISCHTARVVVRRPSKLTAGSE